MTLVPLTLPPGVYKNGTRYQAKGRWYSANRVRWHDGALRPIGGWQRRVAATGAEMSLPQDADGAAPADRERYRDGWSWRRNNRDKRLVFGSNRKVIWLKDDATTQDITPTDAAYMPGPGGPATLVGYGTWLYGRGAYGVPRDAQGLDQSQTGRWRFQNWGEELMAAPDWITDGNAKKLYQWDGGSGTVLEPVLNAPEGFDDFVVTDQRIVMTIGGSNELRIVQWSDQEDQTLWAPDVTNQAGSFVLPGTGRMVAIVASQDVTLIITESDAWIARYTGPPYVYGFQRLGDGCGAVNRQVVAASRDAVWWMGERGLWMFDGQLRSLPCEIIDDLSSRVSLDNISKAHTWVNSAYREVWWHYAEVGSDEPNRYFYYNWAAQPHWGEGALERSCAVHNYVETSPVMVDDTGLVFDHEQQGVIPGDNGASTGPMEIGGGEKNMAIRYLYPDSNTFGDFTMQFTGRQMPTGAEFSSPVYVYDNPIPVRILGREIMMSVAGLTNNWEFGDIRLDVSPTGTGRR